MLGILRKTVNACQETVLGVENGFNVLSLYQLISLNLPGLMRLVGGGGDCS